MLRPEAPLPAMARPAAPGAVPRPAFNGERGAASAAFARLQAEIAGFVEHGEAQPPGESRLSAEGRGLQARLQARLREAKPDEPAAAGDARDVFLDRIGPWAREAGERLGVAPDILAAQAALESGWGRAPLRDGNGADSHNLFGIKASEGWRGGTVDAPTTEFETGVAVRKSARFRQYGDAAASFRDFTQLLLGSPRYQDALDTGADVQAYAHALARGGYATDPDYAAKLAAVVARLRAKD